MIKAPASVLTVMLSLDGSCIVRVLVLLLSQQVPQKLIWTCSLWTGKKWHLIDLLWLFLCSLTLCVNKLQIICWLFLPLILQFMVFINYFDSFLSGATRFNLEIDQFLCLSFKFVGRRSISEWHDVLFRFLALSALLFWILLVKPLGLLLFALWLLWVFGPLLLFIGRVDTFLIRRNRCIKALLGGVSFHLLLLRSKIHIQLWSELLWDHVDNRVQLLRFLFLLLLQTLTNLWNLFFNWINDWVGALENRLLRVLAVDL